jgi:SAM-dependent methyltransferase
MTRLNIGCGGQIVPGWVNIDRSFSEEQVELADKHLARYLVCDLAEPLPIPDESATAIVAHHVLDLLEPDDLRALLSEVERILTPGGVLRVSSVDYRNAIAACAQGDLDYFRALGVPDVGSAAETFAWYLNWGGARRTVLYAPAQLGLDYLEPAGFKWEVVGFHETTAMPSVTDLDSREDESWFIEAKKS